MPHRLSMRAWLAFCTLLSLLVSPNNLRGQPLLVATPMVKLGIDDKGIYQLTFDDLMAAGWSVEGLDPRTIKLYQQGAEVAIQISGEEDGVFDAEDFLLFYGQEITSRYTDTNVYWLTTSEDAGKRMQQRDATPSLPLAPPQQFLATLHAEEDTNYWQAMPGKGEDRWFWEKRLGINSVGIPASRTYTVTTPQITSDATAALRVRLKGYSGLAHHSRIYVNEHLIDEQHWQGQTQFTHVSSFPQSYLLAGDNQVRVEVAPRDAAIDQLLVNWIELDTWRTYQVDRDQLWFTPATVGLQQFAIGGFSSADGTIFDVSDPVNPVQLTGATLVNAGGGYQLVVQDNTQTTAHYVAITPARYKAPPTRWLDQPTLWRSPTNGADYILITHEDFYASAIKLANHRSVSGLRTAVVKVGDLYDEFNYGIFDPRAIKDFLAYAFANWQAPAPTYVLLLGDANQDYKDNLKLDTPNYVPSQVIDSDLFGEVSSDSWFAAIHGSDPRPALAIGRLAAQSPTEAEAMVDKVIYYDQPPADNTWKRSLLFVADDDEPSFKALSEQLAAQAPSYFLREQLYAERYPPGDLTADLINQFNRGHLLVTYTGHGSFAGWGQWDGNGKAMFTTDSAATLTNRDRLPLLVVANCLNGFFTGAKQNPALAETLQRNPNGGAIAVWAPSSLEYSAGHAVLLRNLYQSLFADHQPTIGAAITAAASATYAENPLWEELILTYILFGDPATKLVIPENNLTHALYLPIITHAHKISPSSSR